MRQTYSKVQDASVIFDIKTKINSTRQASLTVTEYFNKMNGLWLELDQYQEIKMVCNTDATTLNQIIKRDRIVEFLTRLNDEFDQVRIQIFGREKVPSLNEVFAMVRSEENQRGVMLSDIGIEGSATITAKKDGARFSMGKIEAKNREGLWCNFCNKPRHTRDHCFKLHGKEAVLKKMGGFKNMATQKQAYISAKEQEEGGIASKGKSIPGTNLAKLDSEEINKLTVFLKTINDRNCVFAQQGNCLHSVSLNASKTDKNDIWILNSRAPDHMTPDLLVFDTYEPIVTSK